MNELVIDQDEASLEVLLLPIIKQRDPFVLIQHQRPIKVVPIFKYKGYLHIFWKGGAKSIYFCRHVLISPSAN